jgi:eukaryotic-like serine/threonine-protein kinase
VGPYLLESRIGAGGMGEVWKARDTRLGRTVAIKRLLEHLERFEQEARAISALNHPNICQLYDIGPDYLVLEYIEGQPLRGPLPIGEAIRAVLPIAAALEQAHRRGILHRDLKPANILLTSSGTAKLLDFGLAKVLRGEIDVTQSADGMIVGTATYMSPEQAQGQPADVRSDIFSFGAVVYELVSGRRPFAGNTGVQILAAVLHEDPRPLDTGSELDRIVMRCLRKRPGDRFQSMSDLRVSLEQALARPEQRQPSIAVLPFANLSADKENEYFSDGLAEEIINALTRIPGLKVTARTSAFAFRGKDQDIRRIAEALDVRTVLEGSVRRAGNRIRVSAQLIDAVDGYHLWSERYDGELADVFAVQDEIATAIAKALQVKLASTSAPTRYTPSIACYEAYLKALHEERKLTPEALARSRDWFEQAIALDPNFALAHSRFGFHFSQLANYALLPAHTAMPLVRREAGRALEIDRALPDGHAMLGMVAALYDYDWSAAERHFALAMGTDPVPSQVRRHYAHYYLLPVGRYHDAAEQCARALTEDPLDLMGRLRYAQCLRASGQVDEAKREQRQALELDENLWFSHFLVGLDHLIDGHHREALQHGERAYALAPWNPSAAGLRAAVLKIAGDDGRAREIVTQLESDRTGPTALGLAIYHLLCSDLDTCADWTERAIADRHPAIFYFLCHATALRESHRWPALARQVNLGSL